MLRVSSLSEAGVASFGPLKRDAVSNELGLDVTMPTLPHVLRDVSVTSPPVPLLYTAVSVLQQRAGKLAPAKDPSEATPTIPPPVIGHVCCPHARATPSHVPIMEAIPRRSAAMAVNRARHEHRSYSDTDRSRDRDFSGSETDTDSDDDHYAAGLVRETIRPRVLSVSSHVHRAPTQTISSLKRSCFSEHVIVAQDRKPCNVMIHQTLRKDGATQIHVYMRCTVCH
jgi:hypothetical protein